jgi:hypothetical protein
VRALPARFAANSLTSSGAVASVAARAARVGPSCALAVESAVRSPLRSAAFGEPS